MPGRSTRSPTLVCVSQLSCLLTPQPLLLAHPPVLRTIMAQLPLPVLMYPIEPSSEQTPPCCMPCACTTFDKHLHRRVVHPALRIWSRLTVPKQPSLHFRCFDLHPSEPRKQRTRSMGAPAPLHLHAIAATPRRRRGCRRLLLKKQAARHGAALGGRRLGCGGRGGRRLLLCSQRIPAQRLAGFGRDSRISCQTACICRSCSSSRPRSAARHSAATAATCCSATAAPLPQWPASCHMESVQHLTSTLRKAVCVSGKR